LPWSLHLHAGVLPCIRGPGKNQITVLGFIYNTFPSSAKYYCNQRRQGCNSHALFNEADGTATIVFEHDHDSPVAIKKKKELDAIENQKRLISLKQQETDEIEELEALARQYRDARTEEIKKKQEYDREQKKRERIRAVVEENERKRLAREKKQKEKEEVDNFNAKVDEFTNTLGREYILQLAEKVRYYVEITFLNLF
jgi:hypothetical protein